MATVLFPIPRRDFDPSEIAVGWQTLVRAGHRVVFATPDARPGRADPVMLDGRGLDPWGYLPIVRRIVVVGRLLRADRAARRAYAEMLASEEFREPFRWDAIDPSAYDALYLGGGHRARGMREYLESPVLQRVVAAFFAREAPVAAICHGVLLAARTTTDDGRSMLAGRRTTSLTWALERTAARIGRVVRFWDPWYYRTYRDGRGRAAGHMSVEAEVTRALGDPALFVDVAPTDANAARKTSGRHRDTTADARPAHVVRDGAYLSARWPGDVHTFARTFTEMLDAREKASA